MLEHRLPMVGAGDRHSCPARGFERMDLGFAKGGPNDAVGGRQFATTSKGFTAAFGYDPMKITPAPAPAILDEECNAPSGSQIPSGKTVLSRRFVCCLAS